MSDGEKPINLDEEIEDSSQQSEKIQNFPSVSSDSILADRQLNVREFSEQAKNNLFEGFKWIVQYELVGIFKADLRKYLPEGADKFDTQYNGEINEEGFLLDLNGIPTKVTPIDFSKDIRMGHVHHQDFAKDFLSEWSNGNEYVEIKDIPESVSIKLHTAKQQILESIALERIIDTGREDLSALGLTGRVDRHGCLIKTDGTSFSTFPTQFDTYSNCHKNDEEMLSHKLKWYMDIYFTTIG